MHKVRGEILDLAVRKHSHCTSASNWELPLLCSLSLAAVNLSIGVGAGPAGPVLAGPLFW